MAEYSVRSHNQTGDREMQLLRPILLQTIREFSALSNSPCTSETREIGMFVAPNFSWVSIRPISICFRPISHMGGTARSNGLNKPSLVCLAQLRIRKWPCVGEKEQQKHVEERLYIIELRMPAAPEDVVGNVRKGPLVCWLDEIDENFVEYVQFGALS